MREEASFFQVKAEEHFGLPVCPVQPVHASCRIWDMWCGYQGGEGYSEQHFVSPPLLHQHTEASRTFRAGVYA